MGAEDWSYVLQRVPGAMMFLGGTHPDRDLASAAPNHSNRVLFDEDAMVNGIATYAAVALDHLSGLTDRSCIYVRRFLAVRRPIGPSCRGRGTASALAGDRFGHELPTVDANCVTKATHVDVLIRRPSVDRQRLRRRVTSSYGRRVRATIPSLTSKPLAGSSSRLHRDAAVIRPSARTLTRARSPPASWSRTTRSPDPSSASLTASTSTPTPVTRTTGAGIPCAPPPTNGADREVETLGLGDHVGAPRPVREQADRDLVAPLVRVGVRVPRRAGEADSDGAVEQGVAVAPVVEHGHAEGRFGDVDVTVGAHLELGRVPRRRRVRRTGDGAELDAARRGVGPDVERERHRQQVLGVLPVEVDVHVEAGEPARRTYVIVADDGPNRRSTRTMPTSGPSATTSTDSAPVNCSGVSRTHASRSHAS